MKCEKGEGPVLELDQPINVTKSGEFEGPAYGIKEVQPVGVDVGHGLREGPAVITGTLNYGLSDEVKYESHLCLETSPLIAIFADSVTGAKDRDGNPIGVKVIYFNTVRSVFQAKDGEKLSGDFIAIRKASGMNAISFRGEENMNCAYQFIYGSKTMTIPLSRQNDAYADFAKFFGIK
jgi:hypothetical protein